MHEKFIMFNKRCLVLVILLVPIQAYSATNIAMSQFLNDIRGSSFNLLIAKPNIIDVRKSKRRKRAIVNGFKKEVRNMGILLRKLKLNAKIKAPGYGGDVIQYAEKENYASVKLARLIEAQTTLWESKLSEDISINVKSEDKKDDGELSDDIGADIDFDTDIIETTDDENVLDGKAVTTGKVANDYFLDIGFNYAPLFRGMKVNRYVGDGLKEITLSGSILKLQDIYIPYQSNKGPVPLPLHAVFGSAFLPDKLGAIHVMRLYVFVIVNDPETEKVRVAAKPVPRFRWDRNEYYISAATGSVLRAIFSEALGVKVEDN